MNTVTVYRYKIWDQSEGGYSIANRWGTIEGITALAGEILKETAVEVDAAVVGRDIPGLTDIGFDPTTR